MSKRIHPLLLLTLVVTACAVPSVSTEPGTGIELGEADDQGSPWWEGRTWEGEVEICTGVFGDLEGCHWLANELEERGCALRTFQPIAVGMSFGLSLDVLHAEAANSGDCPPIDG